MSHPATHRLDRETALVAALQLLFQSSPSSFISAMTLYSFTATL